MSYRWHMPVDPGCPDVRAFRDACADDPMGEAMGAPMDEIHEAFEQRHRASCTRCQEYGAANVEVT